MQRIIKSAGLALVLVLSLSGIAGAATPFKGVFTGSSDAGHSVRIEVEQTSEIALLKVKDACDTIYKWRGVKVNDEGGFVAKKPIEGFPSMNEIKVKGSFTRRSVAKGTIEQVTCEGVTGTFRADLVVG